MTSGYSLGVVRASPDTTFDTTFQKSYQSRIEDWDWFGRAVHLTVWSCDDKMYFFIKTNTILIDLGGAA